MSRALLYTTILLTGLALFAMPLSATPSCVQKAAAEHAGVPVGEATVIENADPLFLELPVAVAVGDSLTFEISVGGSVSLTETIELTRAPEAAADAASSVAPVVELLAAHPARLDFLRRAAAQGHVEISLVQGDAVLGVYAFDQLATASEALEQAGVHPYDLRSTLAAERDRPALGERPSWKYTCAELCDMEQEYCYEYQCEQYGYPTCYNACDTDWEDCLADCGFCEPSTTSTTSTTLLSSTANGPLVCTVEFQFPNSPPGRRGYQRQFRQEFKHTTTTTTNNTDCSQTVTTSVSYSTEYCHKWISFTSCPNPRTEVPSDNC